jgi:diguanylate cyclase (GGDEF)-like protein
MASRFADANDSAAPPPGDPRDRDARDPLPPAIARLARELDATIVFVEHRGKTLRSVCSVTRRHPALPIDSVRDLVRHRVGLGRLDAPALVVLDAEWWTVVPVASPSGAATLFIRGDCTAATAALTDAAADLSRRVAWRIAASRRDHEIEAYRLTRRLAASSGFAHICELAAAARAVGARIASAAVFEPSKQTLRVLGTYGYSKLLVEHTRIKPGEGVIGAVFQSGLPLCVTDVQALGDAHRSRPRYRTRSFVAVPIRTGHHTLGVVSVADRADGEPFTRDDLSALRALVAPVALAVSRELAIGEAEQYAHAAAVDPVSGLFNRRYLHVRLEEELERARRHSIPLALLMIDLDDFKRVNDSFGHLAGDAVIKETAAIVRRTVRMFDVCTRYGGEEFAVLMPNSNSQSAASVAERIRHRIASHRFAELSLASASITVSIGLAVSSAHLLPRELLDRADRALYEAKRAGKNRVCVS